MKLRLAILLLFLTLGAGSAAAQGCSMCAASAQGADEQGRSALARGVTVLLIPPVGFMALFFGLAFRYRRGGGDDSER
jgi:hypothetical protein